MPMIAFPNAKINLGLQILRKRPDNYHNISSLLYPIPLCDALELVVSEALKFTSSGIPIPGAAEDNLCVKAYHLLRSSFELPPVHIHLHKVIPMGGGLGGGSSNGAFVLKMLNEKFQLGLDDHSLELHASRLGSDCPFFIRSRPAVATGTGTKLEAFELSLKGYYLVLVFPGIHISTREAYAGVKPAIPETPLVELLQLKPEAWKNKLVNDFEASVFPAYPALGRLKDMLYENGARYVSMTGSGSTMYGIFSAKPPALNLPAGMTSWEGWL